MRNKDDYDYNFREKGSLRAYDAHVGSAGMGVIISLSTSLSVALRWNTILWDDLCRAL